MLSGRYPVCFQEKHVSLIWLLLVHVRFLAVICALKNMQKI